VPADHFSVVFLKSAELPGDLLLSWHSRNITRGLRPMAPRSAPITSSGLLYRLSLYPLRRRGEVKAITLPERGG
jgi:hypothetical protein